MDVENLKKAAECYGKMMTLKLAKESIREMMDSENWNEDSFNLMDADSQIVMCLTGAIDRGELLTIIAAKICDEEIYLNSTVKSL